MAEDELRTRAIEVLRRYGYRNSSMSRIAQETGVSVRTLHRYFPAKADIVWGGIEGSIDALRHALETADHALTPFDTIMAAVVDVFSRDADTLELGRARMRIIATEPELASTRPETYRQWREELTDHVASRLGLSVDDIGARAAASAILSAIMSAIAWWATQDDETISPVDAVKRALTGLGAMLTVTQPQSDDA